LLFSSSVSTNITTFKEIPANKGLTLQREDDLINKRYKAKYEVK
jgi:hypothetical protein